MTEMVKKAGTDRRHTTWTLARLAGCGDPDAADVVATPHPTIPAEWPEQPIAYSVVTTIPERPHAVAFERATGDWLTSDDCERAGYWYPNRDVIWLNRVTTCGACGRSWDWGTPAGRCPFESFHGREYEPGSAGARFLRSVEDAVYEAWEYATEKYGGDDPADMVKLMQTDGRVTELADSAVPTYYGNLWATFTDLAAYDEEIDDTSYVLADDGRSVNPHKLAGVALYMIAERLAWALLEELAEGEEEAE